MQKVSTELCLVLKVEAGSDSLALGDARLSQPSKTQVRNKVTRTWRRSSYGRSSYMVDESLDWG